MKFSCKCECEIFFHEAQRGVAVIMEVLIKYGRGVKWIFYSYYPGK